MPNATRPSRLPDISGPTPGAGSSALAEHLAKVESRNVTYRSESFPIFWDRARGSNVWDVDGNRYVDLTAGFGVAATGHGHPKVVAAIQTQAKRLVHGMGDVHPPSAKVELLDRLAAVAPMTDARSVLCTSGSEAVEVALKTACLATGKPGVLAFTGAYHGLTYGALSVTDRSLFRGPFEAQLNPHVVRVDFPHPYRVPARLAQPAPDEDAPRSTGPQRLAPLARPGSG
jgi:4-aminobutyrate aminotransferase-like enzyme